MTGYLVKSSYVEGESKLDQIVDGLEDIFKKYPNYDLYITGHSLGGSLAQLLSFLLAGSKKTEFIPKPIVAVTYASPVVGNKGFVQAYQDLEKEDKVRHIRVSNDKDMVPGTVFGFKQTGINFHVKDGPMEVGYLKSNSIISQTNLAPLDRHNLYGEGSYNRRLFRDENSEYLKMTVNELYEKYAGISSKKK